MCFKSKERHAISDSAPRAIPADEWAAYQRSMRERFRAELVPLAWEVIHKQLEERKRRANAAEKPRKQAARSAETNARIPSTNHEKSSGKSHEETKIGR